MKTFRSLVVFFTAAAVGVLGCSAKGPESTDGPVTRQAEAVTVLNSQVIQVWLELAGRGLNGTMLNGSVLENRAVLGVSLNNIVLDGKPLRAGVLENSVFVGLDHRYRLVRRRDFVGAVFTASLDDGSQMPLRVEDVDWDSSGNNTDVLRYTVSYQTSQEWKPLCGLDANGQPVKAIPLKGRWDYRQGVEGGGAWIDDSDSFTFGCEGFVLAKCVLMGYKPWAQVLTCAKHKCSLQSLAPYHQACTRLLRADYCGNGVSYTVDGTLVNVYDGFGIRVDSEDWQAEAEWDANGARCVARERIESMQQPPCWSSLIRPGCGNAEHFSSSGTLLISEDSPAQ